MADEIKATPPKNKPALGMSKAVQKVHEFLSKPFGYKNPPGELLSELVGIPAVAQTLERIGYGEPLTTGAGGLGGTSRPRPEAIEAGMAVAPLSGPAVRAAGKTAKFAGRGAADLIERGMFGEGPLAPITPQVLGVIKPKGGNWLTGSVEKAVEPLKRYDLPDLFPEFGNPPPNSPANIALNKWIDRNLTNYIKKEMATPEDPVRKLAEKGIVHIPSDQVGINRYKAPYKRSLYDGEQLGQSEAAKAWEDASDVAINAPFAQQMVYGDMLEKNPWLSKLDPQERVYALNTPASGNQEISGLGFDHIVDVLKEDLATGRIRPEQLSKVSMEQAVRRTYEYDQEMAKKMREAQIKATEGMPVYKEYPEGYRWVELKAPEELPEGWTKRKGALGETLHYDPEGRMSVNPNQEKLEQALKYEGETMGHCVGGYCPDVIEGRSRIFSLRDAKGEPHVTVEVQPFAKHDSDFVFYELEDKLGRQPTQQEWDAAMAEKAPKIVQIKGKQNRAPKEEYLPFVQDFVRSGQWSDVGDLGNTGLYRINKDFLGEVSAYMPEAEDIRHLRRPQREEALVKAIESKDLPESGYVTRKEWEEAIRKHGRPTYGEEADELLRQLQQPIPPTEGMKRGGVVISDNPDTMMLELQDKKYQFGGLVKRGASAAKKGIPFFSKADEVAKELPRTKGTGAEFMKELEKAKGVKPAEIQHRKLDEIKAMPKMTKEQFLGELEKRPPANLTEKVLKQPSKAEIDKMAEELAETEAQRYAKRHAESWREEEYLFKEEKERLLKNDMDRLRQDARFELTSGIENKGSAPKYEERSIPGGKDYREILLRYEPYGDGTPLGNAVRALGYKGDLNDLSPRMLSDLGAPENLVNQWKNAIDTYRSSHYKEPNVIAHARVSDRVTPEGERVLHVEEIQSDWHQAGRSVREKEIKRLMEAKGISKKEASALVPENFGYKSNIDPEENKALVKQWDTLANERRNLERIIETGDDADPVVQSAIQRHGEVSNELNAVNDRLTQIRTTFKQGVPDAPFKKNWHELMMNRILADAAEKGYDRVALTPGVVQAERYDLSKQVSSLMFYTDPGAETGVLRALDLNGDPVIKERIPVSKLDDYVGKDAAKKLLDQTPIQNETTGLPSELRTLNGVDLQVGGEGMKGFYDKMLPDYLNNLGKKYGVEVEPLGVNIHSDLESFMPKDQMELKTLHSFKITPEMRQEFTEKGFPMYSIAAPVGIGATQMPVEEPKPVQITDNPDAMMLELGDREFAGGGIIKRLARAPAKSKQEIEAIAERIAPQVTGEFVRKPKETQSVAGKTQKQFAREKDLPVKFTDVKPVPKVEVIDPEQLQGMVVTGVPGDPTVTGKSLVSVGDIKLDSPSPQHGGPLYGLGRDDDIFWASGIDPAGRVQTVAKEAMQAYDAPVAGQYIMMGPDSINYAQHFADANLSAIDLSKMTKRQIEEFNKLIRFGNAESGPRPSFPGIENKEEAYLHLAFDPALRKHFNAMMQMPTVTERFNLPSGQDIRFAITEAPLRDLETGVTGYSMGRLAPEVPKSALPLSMHPTYSHDIPGRFMGGLKYPTPYELTFPDTLKSVMEHPRQQLSPFGSLKYVGPRQIYDQQMVDELKMYEEAMKRLTGKKEGGQVKKPKMEEVKEKVITETNRAINRVLPMRGMARGAMMDALLNSSIAESIFDPEINAMLRETDLNSRSDQEEFKRLHMNRLKRMVGMPEKPTPNYDWDKTIKFEAIEGVKPSDDGFQKGGLIKVKNKRKAKA